MDTNNLKSILYDLYAFTLINKFWVMDLFVGEVYHTSNETYKYLRDFQEKSVVSKLTPLAEKEILLIIQKRSMFPNLRSPAEREAKRLEIQGRIMSQSMNELLELINFSHVKNILEVGCGTGVFTEKILEQTNNDTQIVGVDLDSTNLSLAQSKFENIMFVQADASSLPFESRRFDCVISHLFFNQLANPCEVLKEIVRVTSEDGMVISIDTDTTKLLYPEATGSEKKLESVYQTYMSYQGIDINIGRKLIDIYNQVGLEECSINIIPQAYFGEMDTDSLIEVSKYYIFLYKNLERSFYQMGLISSTEFAEGLRDTLKRMDSESFQMVIRVMVSGRVKHNGNRN